MLFMPNLLCGWFVCMCVWTVEYFTIVKSVKKSVWWLIDKKVPGVTHLIFTKAVTLFQISCGHWNHHWGSFVSKKKNNEFTAYKKKTHNKSKFFTHSSVLMCIFISCIAYRLKVIGHSGDTAQGSIIHETWMAGGAVRVWLILSILYHNIPTPAAITGQNMESSLNY